MTQSTPLVSVLMVGFLGAFATMTALWITGAAWWALVLGYGMGGAISILLITLVMAARDSSFDGPAGPVNAVGAVAEISLAAH